MSEKNFFFFVKREIPLLFFVNCERADLFFVKRDLYPPFTTLYVAPILLKLRSGKAIFVRWVNLIHPKVRNSTVFILPGTRNVQNYKI